MMRMAGPVLSEDRAKETESRNLHLRAIGMILIGGGYLVLVPYLGYMLTVGLLLLTVAIYNGKRPSPGLLLFGALGSIGFYLLFVQLLDVPLPAGFWPSLIG
jgi:hypothetical protein